MDIKVLARIMADITCDCGARFMLPADRLMAGEIILCECGRAAEIGAEHMETAEFMALMVLAGVCAATSRVFTLGSPHKPGK
jgi:hypothetical protein